MSYENFILYKTEQSVYYFSCMNQNLHAQGFELPPLLQVCLSPAGSFEKIIFV